MTRSGDRRAAGRREPEWDPGQLKRFGDLKKRPYRELLARVGAETPRRVVDAGMGTNSEIPLLTERWPDAAVEAFHESAEHVAILRRLLRRRGVDVSVGDVAAWLPGADVDVVMCTKVLHWVPDHVAVMTRWARALTAGGWLAVQMPSDFSAPAHGLIHELAKEPRWREELKGVLPDGPVVGEPQYYAQRLAELGCRVDAWESTYTVQLPITNPLVLFWLAPTAARPVYEVLGRESLERFSAELEPRLQDAYPSSLLPGEAFPGSWLRFQRVFVVVQAPAEREPPT